MRYDLAVSSKTAISTLWMHRSVKVDTCVDTHSQSNNSTDGKVGPKKIAPIAQSPKKTNRNTKILRTKGARYPPSKPQSARKPINPKTNDNAGRQSLA
jgi:hypothetical protein